MPRRILIPFIALALLPAVALAAPCPQPTPGEPRTYPNIVLIVADDLGWDDLPYFNPEIAGTMSDSKLFTSRRPDLNRFAARSLAKEVGNTSRAEALDGTDVSAIDQLPGAAIYNHANAQNCAALQPTSCTPSLDILGRRRPTPGPGGLRRLAEDVTVSRFYAASSVCSPSRASILTGQHVGVKNAPRPGQHQVTSVNYDLATEHVTIAEYLKQGCPGRCLKASCPGAPCYTTALFGKWHLGEEESRGRTPSRQGFDRFVGFFGGERDHFAESDLLCSGDGCPNGNYPVPKEVSSELQRIRECNDDGPTGPAKCSYQDRIYRDLAVDFIDEQEDLQDDGQQGPSANPYFVMVTFHAPHSPLTAPERTAAHYETLGVKPPSPRYGRPAAFWAMVEEIDFAVGEILDRVGPNTLVLFTSDNGRPKGGPRYGAPTLRGAKRGTFDGGLRVGLLARVPARDPDCGTPGERLAVDDFVAGHADILPTIASAIGFENYQGGFCIDADGAPCTCGSNGCRELQVRGKSFYDVINRAHDAEVPAAAPPYVVSRYLAGQTIVGAPGHGATVPNGKRGVCATTSAALPDLPRRFTSTDVGAGSCVTCATDAECTTTETYCKIPGPGKVCVKTGACPNRRCPDHTSVWKACTQRSDCIEPGKEGFSCQRATKYEVKCNTCRDAAWKLKRSDLQARQLFDTVTNPSEDNALNCMKPTPTGALAAIKNRLDSDLTAELLTP